MKKNMSYNYILKVVFIIGLLLLFLVPFIMIRGIVLDRQHRSAEAEQEIISLWGGRQTIAGPFITVPYKKIITEETENGTKSRAYTSYFFITPEKLDIQAAMSSEMRKRGIYEIPVYQTEAVLSGSFTLPDISGLHIDERDIYWDEALLTLELPDMRAIKTGTQFLWNDNAVPLSSGVSRTGIFINNLQGALWQLKEKNYFVIDLNLRGAGSLSFIPFGNQTDVQLESDWPAPSFYGAFLPEERSLLDEEGFTASWSVHSLARPFPTVWKQDDMDRSSIVNSSFGVNLFKPVDMYAKAERSVKYGMLFIILPFIAFFLLEVFSKNRIHMLQYLMVGAANTIFYLLLLSLSEHIGFNPAYLIGAAATSALIVFYSTAILPTKKQGLLMAPVMVALYTFLFTVLQSEDYALLIGSLGLFALVALVMMLTRKVDWYSLNQLFPKSE